MDSKYFNIAATYLDNLEIFPYFNICHYLLVSIYVRQLSPGNKVFSRQHPLSSWFGTMLMCFAGSFLSNFLIGEALIVPLKTYENLFHASVCWYLINYFPFDLFYNISTFLPIYLSLSLAKELYRARMIHIGVAVAAKRYPDALLIWLLIGLVKGCGEDILVPLARASMGLIDTTNNALLNPTFNLKGSLACALIFSLEKLHKTPLVSSQMFMGALLFLTYFRVSSIVIGIKDPFIIFENLICGIFFGGLVDYIKGLSSHKPNTKVPNHNERPYEAAPGVVSGGGGVKAGDTNGKGDTAEESQDSEEEEQDIVDRESEVRERSTQNATQHNTNTERKSKKT